MSVRAGRTFTALVALLAACVARGEDEPPPTILPTVTAQSGDVGGTFFGRAPDPQKTHHYYIAAESVPWDFAPTGRDDICGLVIPPAVAANLTRQKLRYIQYTDATFRTRAIPNPSLGILGPVLRGVVGEFLAVTFLNRTTQPLSMHPHGVLYDKNSEGAYYRPNSGRGAAVAPGGKFTYVWQLDENSGPRPDEPSSKAWLYHSHVLGDVETNLGLIGCIIVTDPKRARPDGTPIDIDREFATLFMIFDESGLDSVAVANTTSASTPAASLGWAKTRELIEQNERYAINGRIFGNLRGLEMNAGERTRWYLFALGSEQDFHTAHWHGLRVIEEGRRRTDVVELLPATMKVADLVADNPGSWLFHCHVAEHMREGMFARMTVYAADSVGVSRTAESAFLGLPSALESLHLDHAESVLNLKTTPARAEVVLNGTATAPDPLKVAGLSMRVALGPTAIDFHPNEQGVAREPRAMLRVLNADETGVVHGGVLNFELVFNGTDWLESATRVEPATPGAPSRTIPLTLEFGDVHHATVAHIVSRVNQR